MEEKITLARQTLEYNLGQSISEKDLKNYRGKLNEEGAIMHLLDAKIDSNIIKRFFCKYFWALYYKEHYERKIQYHKAGENAHVPTSFSKVDYNYLNNRLLYWKNEINKIESILKNNIIDEELSQDEKQAFIQNLLEEINNQDLKEIEIAKAVDRYSALTNLKKFGQKLKSKNPEKLDFDSMSVDEINNLYTKK